MTATLHSIIPPEPTNWCDRPVRPVELPSTGQMGAILFIQRTVAASYGVAHIHMRSKSRCREAAWPRQVAMYLSRKIAGKSCSVIGREFGGRDHSTVIYAVKAVEKRMADDPVYRADVQALREAIGG